MATNTPLNSDTSTLPESSSAELEPSSSAEHGLCLPYDEAVKELPVFLQPSDGQEQKDLAMFLSQVDELHKPVAGKLSARFVFNFVEHMLKPATPITEKPKEVTIPEQLQEPTENIAFEIVNSVINDVDLHNTTISVLNVLQEVSWEIKAALMIATFILTFEDNGLNLCEESKVSVHAIQMFAKLKDGFKHQLDDSDNLFTIVFKLIDSIVEFEILPTTYMAYKDSKFKVARTHLIVAIYWIIRIIVAAASSHIIKLSSTGNEFDKVISTLWELPRRWSKKLEILGDSGHLKATLIHLQDLLKEDVDIGAYYKIKEIIEQENHNDNIKVLNTLIPSDSGGAPALYDCLRKRKVQLDELKGEYVLLFISGLENIAPEGDEFKLNEFMDSFYPESDQSEGKILWMPITNGDRSLQPTKTTGTSTRLKPFLDWYYLVRYTKLLEDRSHKEWNFKGWYSVENPSRISNEVKKLIREDWKYKGEPMIVVLDPQGNVVHHNAIHMLYLWEGRRFPYTSETEEVLWKKFSFGNTDYFFRPASRGLDQFFKDLEKEHDCFLLYGGENIEWIRSFTGMVRQVELELGASIKMVYVGSNHNQELMRSVKEENLSHCLSDPFFLWLFWKRIESFIYSPSHMVRRRSIDCYKSIQMLLNNEKSNVGWVIIYNYSGRRNNFVGHGKVVLTTLKEFKQWKEKASNEGFVVGFRSHYEKLYRKIFPFQCVEFPTAAIKASAPIETMLCPKCNSQMQEYTSFVCYHPPPRG